LGWEPTEVPKITFVISSLRGGGAERVLSNMAGYWAEKGWDITILTLYQGDAPVSYDLHPRVVHLDLLKSTLHRNPRPDRQSMEALRAVFKVLSPSERRVFLRDLVLIVALRHAIRSTNPDTVISFIDITNVYVLLATHDLHCPVLVSERCDPRQGSLGHDGWDRLRERLYPNARHVVVLDHDSLSFFGEEVRQRARVIPNAALPPRHSRVEMEKAQKKTGRTLLAMGRLDHGKGFDLLLDAFSRVAPRQPWWSLEIWGLGPLRASLESLAFELGLDGRVRFPGFTRNRDDVMRQADLFVLSSRFEGFPNVLLEAMASGLPAVSFDCPTGPRRIIRSGIDGQLVPPQDVAALSENLERLMENHGERQRLASRAPDVIERFNVDVVMGKWEELVRGSAPPA
jgi:GalNAc-alpha-(1->4)-GalNAc-alpha-(1->3)-diNAcBac-PP-undecaprenol alpha-1,4-N-acetyl-D-galactosaminyltransferase